MLENREEFEHLEQHRKLATRVIENMTRVDSMIQTLLDVSRVRNSGNPIAPEDQARLFDSYFQTASAKNSGSRGWGLGLALVEWIAEAHGGQILVESSAAGGTVFSLRLPIRISAPANGDE